MLRSMLQPNACQFSIAYTIIIIHLRNMATTEVIVLDKFNVRNEDWLGSSKTHSQSIVAEIFEIANNSSNINHDPHSFSVYRTSIPIN